MDAQGGVRAPGSDRRSHQGPLRILALSRSWLGANDNSFVSAFRRLGHSTRVVSDEIFFPVGWTSARLKALRRVLTKPIIREFQAAFRREAADFSPDLVFVFKGAFIDGRTLRAAKAAGAVAVNFYPDIGLSDAGPYVLDALPFYDWIFNTKSFRVDEMRAKLGMAHVSFMPHAFDPEVHRPVDLDAFAKENYRCDASFIGTWTPKKEKMLLDVCSALPNVRLKIWGRYWERAGPGISRFVTGREVTGLEYAKAIRASRISIAILVERMPGFPQGDLTTARTFEIPASGGFMLHERTDEARGFFEEGRECAMFAGSAELVEKLRYYLAHDEERKAIAEAGFRRAIASGYSYDDRAAVIIAKARQLLEARTASRAGA